MNSYARSISPSFSCAPGESRGRVSHRAGCLIAVGSQGCTDGNCQQTAVKANQVFHVVCEAVDLVGNVHRRTRDHETGRNKETEDRHANGDHNTRAAGSLIHAAAWLHPEGHLRSVFSNVRPGTTRKQIPGTARFERRRILQRPVDFFCFSDPACDTAGRQNRNGRRRGNSDRVCGAPRPAGL